MVFWHRKQNSEDNQQPGKPLIAIVDDEEDLCRLLGLSLNMHGYDSVVAYDGASGLELIRIHRPALILLDIMMPRMNGYQVLARLQKDPELSEIPVIVMTSLTEPDHESDEQWAEKLGVQQFITKPVDTGVIIQAIQQRIPTDMPQQ